MGTPGKSHGRRGTAVPTFFVLCLLAPTASAGDLLGAYTDPRYLKSVPFGQHSHFLQPWRAYLETVPASRFVEGIGIAANLNSGEDWEVIAEHLRRNGFRHARVEIGWSELDPTDETRLKPASAARWRPRLAALQKHGLRPLILLNANQNAPGPTEFFARTAPSGALPGARTLKLDDCRGLVAGRSGLNRTGEHSCAAGVLVTAVDAGASTVTLSRPLPTLLLPGAKVAMATLKYRPFGPPDSADFKETLAAWQRYVRTVAGFAVEVLGDGGFDLECWNELSFGSDFLFLNRYYEPKFAKYNEDAGLPLIVEATAATLEPFRGVRLVDGFSNTTPWPGAGDEPARVSALSAHPYPPRRVFPRQEQNRQIVNALFQYEDKGYAPNYSVLFPEYYGTLIQTECVLRDAGPLATQHYHLGRARQVEHGRYARRDNPCWSWLTEINLTPNEQGITDPQAALDFKAKVCARLLCFYLNKGVERLYFYAASPNEKRLGDREFGLVRQNLLDASRSLAEYPADDSPFTAPAMQVVRRLAAAMRDGLDSALTQTRPLEVTQISDTHGHFQFEGDGTPAHPTLFNREVFAFLPFQVNAGKFVVPYYVMTRDILQPLAPEEYRVTVRGWRGEGARASVYDPVLDQRAPVEITARAADSLTLQLSATDSPRLLIVED